MLGSGLLGVLCIRQPGLFPEDVVILAIFLGALLGAGAQHFMAAGINPIIRLFDYYFKLTQLSLLQKRGVIKKKQGERLVKHLTNSYFGRKARESYASHEKQVT